MQTHLVARCVRMTQAEHVTHLVGGRAWSGLGLGSGLGLRLRLRLGLKVGMCTTKIDRGHDSNVFHIQHGCVVLGSRFKTRVFTLAIVAHGLTCALISALLLTPGGRVHGRQSRRTILI